jgi:hypothetical protein
VVIQGSPEEVEREMNGNSPSGFKTRARARNRRRVGDRGALGKPRARSALLTWGVR